MSAPEIPILGQACTSCLYPRLIKLDRNHTIYVGCGHCIPCRIKKTKEWSLRLEMESKSYNFNEIKFVTLTYRDEKLPVAFSTDMSTSAITLYKRDLQLFIKRLRKRLDYPIRYFAVGEYGSRTFRPHYHAIIYGLKSCDVHFVSECWTDGFTLTKPFYNETTYYIAGYVQKKLFSRDDYGISTPPFLVCSQGLGLDFVMRPDVLANIKADPDHCLYVNGYKRSLPRYFREKLYDIGALPKPTYDELVTLQSVSSTELLEFLESQGCDLWTYKNMLVAEAKRKDIKSNRKRNSNFLV